MACCIIAALIVGQCMFAWRWLSGRLGASVETPAALWSATGKPKIAAPPSSRWACRSWRGRRIDWVAGSGVAALAFALVLAAAAGSYPLRHRIAPAVWCFGVADD